MRMHWTYRGVLAFVLGLWAAILIGGDLIPGCYTIADLAAPLTLLAYDPQGGMLVRISILAAVPAMLVALSTYAILTRWSIGPADGETHCRKCNHILRGLSEARCPECGEGI